MSMESALGAARSWHNYRRRGGRRDRIAADFLIGGHAAAQAERLLTRDLGFYRKYFKGVAVLSP
jgi:predicted nucleic acid-binding protein